MRVIDLPPGKVQIESLPSGMQRVTLVPKAQTWTPGLLSCVTGYPLDVIEAIVSTKAATSFGDICLEIDREESVERTLRYSLLSYVSPEWFRGKVILDFGCGMGASTINLARLFPAAQIHGVELSSEFLAIAEMRRKHLGLSNVRFSHSQNGDRLPPEVGTVDAIIMNALFEHLLPDERSALLPMLWQALKPGGILFLSETPHRFWIIEGHTTRLPLLNYLPDALALWATRRWSSRYGPAVSWEFLLREGIRGGSIREIRRLVPTGQLLEPTRLVSDRIDLWYAIYGWHRPTFKRLLRTVSRAVRMMSGLTLLPSLELAIQKPA